MRVGLHVLRICLVNKFKIGVGLNLFFKRNTSLSTISHFKSNFYSSLPNHHFSVISLIFYRRVNLWKFIFGSVGGSILVNNAFITFNTIEAASSSIDNVLDEADVLYDNLEYGEIYELLCPYKEIQNVDVLWRLARSLYEKAKKSDSTSEKKIYFGEALSLLSEAETINENHFAVQKWLAIIKDCYFTLEGLKSRISHLYDIKGHMEKACELKPNDGTSWYVLGMWYFGVANISWYEKKAASIFFAAPPEATYEEALNFFIEAEKVEPNFYSKNHLMIGKCYYYLGKNELAREYFSKAKNYQQKTLDDQEANSEAETWLKSL